MTGKMIEDLARIVARIEQNEHCWTTSVYLADQLADFIDNHRRRGFDRERFLNDALPVTRPMPPRPGLEGFDL
jgi:hypothetical protein